MSDGVIWGTTKIINGVSMDDDITQTHVMSGSRHALLHLVSAGGAGATRAGTIYIQESGDRTNWHNMTLVDKSTSIESTSITVSTTVAVDDTVEIETEAEHIRVFWDFTSGAGTLNAWLTKKA